MKKLILLTLILFSTLVHAELRRGEGADVLVGSIIPFTGPTCPAGTLRADGSAVSRVTYSKLFDAIGTTNGAGNGSTTFNLPISANPSMYLAGLRYNQNVNCNFSTTNTGTFAVFAANALCPTPDLYGSAVSLGKVPALQIPLLPPGLIFVNVNGSYATQTAATSAQSEFAISDGLNTYQILGGSSNQGGAANTAYELPGNSVMFNNTSVRTNVTIQILGRTNNTGNYAGVSAGRSDISIHVIYYPTVKACIKY